MHTSLIFFKWGVTGFTFILMLFEVKSTYTLVLQNNTNYMTKLTRCKYEVGYKIKDLQIIVIFAIYLSSVF